MTWYYYILCFYIVGWIAVAVEIIKNKEDVNLGELFVIIFFGPLGIVKPIVKLIVGALPDGLDTKVIKWKRL